MPQTVLVTGANRGLGLEFVRQLQARGETVIATAREPEAAAELRNTGARVEALDVGDPASIEAFAGSLGEQPIDLLINNAGMGVGGKSFVDEDFNAVETYFRVNSLGPMRLTQRLLPNLRAGQGKRIAGLTSKMGSIADNTSGGAYGYRASKSALNMLNKSMSIDLRREGFTCVVLHPGWVATDMGGAAAPLAAPESVRGMLAVIDGLGPEDGGRFFDYLGAEIPW
jgi:NAD(P)-dependent dehydrogenase (short-subunit alcohol dehydrogenase family)